MKRMLCVLLLALPLPALADEADAHYKSCLGLKQQNKLDEATAECEKALELRESAAAHFTMGNIQRQRNNIPLAVTHFEAAAKMSPKSAPIRANLGAAYLRSGRTADGIRELELAVSIDGKDADAHMNLGTAYRQLAGEAKDAKPGSPEAAKGKANADKALEHLQAAAALRPQDAMLINNLGVAQRQAGRLDDAIVSFKKAIQLKDDEAEYHFNLGTMYRRKSQPDDAIQEYSRAISLKNGFAPAHYDLGIVYEQKKMHEEAVAHFQKYLTLTGGKNPKMDDEVRQKIKMLKSGGPPPAGKRE